MNNGSRFGKGLKLSTHGFLINDYDLLIKLLRDSYSLKVSLHNNFNQRVLFIHANSLLDLFHIVENYLHPSMLFKFNKTIV
jgi:hypothetical protein